MLFLLNCVLSSLTIFSQTIDLLKYTLEKTSEETFKNKSNDDINQFKILVEKLVPVFKKINQEMKKNDYFCFNPRHKGRIGVTNVKKAFDDLNVQTCIKNSTKKDFLDKINAIKTGLDSFGNNENLIFFLGRLDEISKKNGVL